MIRITADRDVCEGFGNCVLADPDVFDIDDDGLVVLNSDTVEDAGLAAAQRAAYDCPTEAITVVSD